MWCHDDRADADAVRMLLEVRIQASTEGLSVRIDRYEMQKDA